MDPIFIFVFLLFVAFLVYKLMVASGFGGHRRGIRIDQKIIFFPHKVRHNDKVKFVVDFSGLGRCPVLGTSSIGEGFDIFSQIGAAILRSYDEAVTALRDKLSRNGYAFKDDDHPVRLDVKFYTENNQAFKTSILIYHSNLYGYCFRAMGIWYCFDDSPYYLFDRQGRQMGNIGFNAAYTQESFPSSVGLSTITQSLRDLNSESFLHHPTVWKRSVLHLCFCLIEAAWFPQVYQLVQGSLLNSLASEEAFYYRVPVERYYWNLVHSWGALSHAVSWEERTGIWSMSQENRDKLDLVGTREDQVAKAKELIWVRC